MELLIVAAFVGFLLGVIWQAHSDRKGLDVARLYRQVSGEYNDELRRHNQRLTEEVDRLRYQIEQGPVILPQPGLSKDDLKPLRQALESLADTVREVR